MKAPTDIAKNIEFRRWALERGDSDPEFRLALLHQFKEDPVFYTNTVHYTYDPKGPQGKRVIPMVTWGRQEETIRWYLERYKTQTPGIVPKTREQAATWSFCAWADWFWTFEQDSSGLWASRKKDLVEAPDLSGLFQKFDFFFKHKRPWVIPNGFTEGGKKFRKDMAAINPITGVTITGETANPNIARGGRFGWIYLDEFAFCENQEAVKAAAGNAADCVFYVSTMNGINEFSEMWERSEYATLELDWQDNPRCNAKTYVCVQGCKAHPQGGKPHSEWYDKQCQQYGWNVTLIAQELDRNVVKSGNPVFDEENVAAAIAMIRDNPPTYRYFKLDLEVPPGLQGLPPAQDPESWYEQARSWDVRATEVSGAVPLRVVKMPFERGDEIYCIGSDVARGVQGADWTIAYVCDVTRGEVVAEFATQTSSDVAAVEIAKLAKWFGTSSGVEWDAWCCVEWNDHGILVNRILKRLGVYVQHYVSEDKRRAQRTEYEGVVVHHANRNRLVEEYLVPAIRDKRENGLPVLVVPFVEFWQECRTFVRVGDETVKAKAADKKHDDRVFAMLHLIYGAKHRHGAWSKVEPDKRQRERLSKFHGKRQEVHVDRPVWGEKWTGDTRTGTKVRVSNLFGS